jgi:hypothetical protein
MPRCSLPHRKAVEMLPHSLLHLKAENLLQEMQLREMQLLPERQRKEKPGIRPRKKNLTQVILLIQASEG